MNQQSIQNQYTIHSRKLSKTLPIVGSLTLTSPPPFLAHPRPPPSYWNRHASQSCHSIGFVATPPNGVNRQGMSPAWYEQGRLIWVFPKIGVMPSQPVPEISSQFGKIPRSEIKPPLFSRGKYPVVWGKSFTVLGSLPILKNKTGTLGTSLISTNQLASPFH